MFRFGGGFGDGGEEEEYVERFSHDMLNIAYARNRHPAVKCF